MFRGSAGSFAYELFERLPSVYHPQLRMPSNQLPILHPIPLPTPLALPNHQKKDRTCSQPYKRSTNEAILIPKVLQPGSNPIPNSKGHGIPNDDDRSHAIAADVTVCVDKVIDAEGDAGGVAEGCAEHGDDEAEPVDFLGGA